MVPIHDPSVWDDSILIRAYDDSLKLAEGEVAKRIAKETNDKNAISVTKTESKAPVRRRYQIGSFVRCTWIDNIDYEGSIIDINEEEEQCLVRFIGYHNDKWYDIDDMCPSWGKKARRKQLEEAENLQYDEADMDDIIEVEQGNYESQTHSELLKEKSKETNVPLRDEKNTEQGYFKLPNLPLPPMPPMPPMLESMTDEAQAFSAMLMSWYMNGYYTGLYQGKIQAKK